MKELRNLLRRLLGVLVLAAVLVMIFADVSQAEPRWQCSNGQCRIVHTAVVQPAAPCAPARTGYGCTCNPCRCVNCPNKGVIASHRMDRKTCRAMRRCH